jgi:predicted acetyltransferase
MTAEYRQLRSDELDRFVEVDRTAFATPAEAPGAELYKMMPLDWTLVAEVDGSLQASVTSLPMVMYMEGSKLRLGGVTSVSCMPEYRRQGHVAALLRQSIELMRERDQPLAGLYTPHNALYRRFGWENCSEGSTYEFHPKKVRLRPGPRPAGRACRAGQERWEDFDGVYRRYAEPRNGQLRRGHQRWQLAFSGGYEQKPGQSFLWESADGTLDGFLLMREQGWDAPSGTPMSVVVRDLVALTPDALRGLVTLILSFDLSEKVVWRTSLDEPVYEIFDDPLPDQRTAGWNHLIRIVDLEKAMALRPCYEPGEVVVEVRDSDCPWNDGRWRIASDGPRFAAERSDAEPALRLDINALAQVFTGYRRPSELARIGRAEVVDDAEDLDNLFRTRYPPFTSDSY